LSTGYPPNCQKKKKTGKKKEKTKTHIFSTLLCFLDRHPSPPFLTSSLITPAKQKGRNNLEHFGCAVFFFVSANIQLSIINYLAGDTTAQGITSIRDTNWPERILGAVDFSFSTCVPDTHSSGKRDKQIS
jgi:hypothetical protein